MELNKTEKWIYTILGTLVVLSLFYQLGYMPLSADEPIRTLIAADMQISGNFIAPEINGETYLNKPPLYNYILYALFEITGSRSECIVRLPSILSLIALGLIVFQVVNRETKQQHLALLTSFAFVTSGNIWMYSSYLGHIDITYSLVVFLHIYVIYRYGLDNKWTKAFVVSYALTFIGFMMKGLPSIVFQGITILTVLAITKEWKRFFSLKHILSGFVFLIPLAVYLWLFSQHAPIEDLLSRILTESTSRTVTEKSFVESIAHLFSFPFLYLVDILPWGLLILLLFDKTIRQKLWSTPFIRHGVLLFLTNIIVYWLSPDYRARYVFMLTPFLLTALLFAGLEADKRDMSVFKWFAYTISFLLIISPILMWIAHHNYAVSSSLTIALTFSLLGLIGLFLALKLHAPKLPFTAIIIGLIVFKFGYSTYEVPFKTVTGPYQQEKLEAQQIAKITKNQPLAMYHSNVSLTMNWYLTVDRNDMLKTETSDHNINAFYLVPTEVISDTTNADTYFTFVRRYQKKPFSLVKFKRYFPDMPKK